MALLKSSLAHSWKGFRRRHFKPWSYVTYAGIRVHYKRHLDGGGTGFGQDLISFLRAKGMPKQGRGFEWCAGPGFIGFSMLGHGLCETLCLADVNDEAVGACRRTIGDNRLAGQVSVYQSDNLKSIPRSERWDLVVSNPPHFSDTYLSQIKEHDEDWGLHRAFFGSVGAFLNPGGVIVLQENNRGSTAETFRSMIEAAGLSVVFVHGCEPRRTPDPRYYYIGMMRNGDTPPPWTIAATGRISQIDCRGDDRARRAGLSAQGQ